MKSTLLTTRQDPFIRQAVGEAGLETHPPSLITMLASSLAVVEF